MPDDSVSGDRISDGFWGTQTVTQRRFWECGALSGVPSRTRIAADALIRNRGLFRHVSEVVGPAPLALNEGGAAVPGWAHRIIGPKGGPGGCHVSHICETSIGAGASRPSDGPIYIGPSGPRTPLLTFSLQRLCPDDFSVVAGSRPSSCSQKGSLSVRGLPSFLPLLLLPLLLLLLVRFWCDGRKSIPESSVGKSDGQLPVDSGS